MTIAKALIISKRDTPSVVRFKKRMAARDNLKLIVKRQEFKTPRVSTQPF
ncbi:MAG: hypothetical protein JW791_03215 [Nanoarchaeota archaeon]|nr:hypothetical protein [Nanoarchaeota archaeon]